MSLLSDINLDSRITSCKNTVFLAKKLATSTIDITTTRNVVVSYELASVMQRAVATVMDSVLVLIVFILLVSIGNFDSEIKDISLGFGWIWLYQLACIIVLNGRSIGQRIMKVRIVSMNGETLEFSDYFLRWIMRPLDITLSAGMVGIFAMLGTERRQRLGDMLAGTTVISERPSVHFTLNDIVTFHEKNDSKQVRYPGVKHVDEADILMLKNLLANTSHYAESVHREALDVAAKKLASMLDLKLTDEDNTMFLQQLVSDYIILTR